MLVSLAGTSVKTGDPRRNRAKNALLQLAHSINYQLMTADGRSYSSMGESASSANGGSEGKRRRPNGLEAGQRTLTFSKEVHVT